MHTPGQMTHVQRHTFASHYMFGGILAQQRILGHGDIKMTMRYLHWAPDHFSTALTLSPLAKLTGQDADTPRNDKGLAFANPLFCMVATPGLEPGTSAL